MKALAKNVDFCNETLSLKQEIEVRFLDIGARLKKIRDDQLWESQWESFGEYLREMDMSEGTASKMINVFIVFIENYKFSPAKLTMGWSKLAETLPYIKTKKDAEEFVHLATILPKEELRQELQEKRTGIEMRTCKHEDTYLIRCCKNCKLKWREYEEEKEIKGKGVTGPTMGTVQTDNKKEIRA